MANVVKLYYVDRGGSYKQWELIPNKLLVVDNVEDYLATKSAYTINDFQYVKNEMEIGINVDLSQTYSQPKSTTSFKYVSIQNEGELAHYYFVKKIIWRSKTTIRLELVMDVLNTFKEGIDYIFKPNTRIIREHKDRLTSTTAMKIELDYYAEAVGTFLLGDRFNLISNAGESPAFKGTFLKLEDIEGTLYLTIRLNGRVPYDTLGLWQAHLEDELESPKMVSEDETKSFVFHFVGLIGDEEYRFNRIIDTIPENINPILQCKDSKGIKLEDKSVLNQNWYLLYRNQNDPDESLVNPVDCFLIPENQTDVNNGIVTNGRIIASTLNANTYYYAKLPNGVVMNLSNGVSITGTSPRRRGMIITKQSNGLMTISLFTESDPIGFTMNYDASYDDISYIGFSSFPIYYYPSLTPIDAYDWYDIFNHDQETYSWTDDYAGDYLDSVELLDRTDAKNIKLIKLPYCPYDFSVSNDILQIAGTDWYYMTLEQNSGDIRVIKLNDLNVKLTRSSLTQNTINPLEVFTIDSEDINPSLMDINNSYEEELESKMFNSEFYSPQFIYDSFAYRIELEKLDQEYYYDTYNQVLNIKFYTTRTINSKFMFEFSSLKLALAESNYAYVMPIARNNEEVLYNVPYINYIRSGYQYDLKNKTTATASNYIGLSLSTLSIGASLLLPSVPLKVAGVVASLVSLGMSIKNTIVSEMNNENSLKQKLDQYKNQGASVAGSDDVDLMSVYAENRLKYLVYEPTPRMRKLIKDLFFYAGYSSNRMGMPNHHSRVNFDYLECEASIEKVASIPDECLNELIGCFKNGVCYLHKTSRVTNKWDFNQIYENWEKSLFQGE